MIDPQIPVILAAAFSLGLLSSAHCVGMCGGIMGALTLAIPAEASGRRLALLLSYNGGRIGSYVLMGALLGIFAGGLQAVGAGFGLRLLAGLLLIAMGLYLANWWQGLTWLERGGRYLWAYIQPLGKALLPVGTAPKALLLGALWGWLPCGLVYTALAYAMTQANALQSGGVMLAFGLGTLPAVLATGLAAQQFARLLQRRGVRTGFAVLIILFGVWTLLGGGHTGGHDHEHAPEENPAPSEMDPPSGHPHHH
jgi:sulfite exporter TauE/SafE